jgi:hypothetical protein
VQLLQALRKRSDPARASTTKRSAGFVSGASLDENVVGINSCRRDDPAGVDETNSPLAISASVDPVAVMPVVAEWRGVCRKLVEQG